jgi:hypothetical protein
MIYHHLPVVKPPVLEIQFTADEVDALRMIFNHCVVEDNVSSHRIVFYCLTEFQRLFCDKMHAIVEGHS